EEAPHLDLMHGHARLQAERDRAGLSDEITEIRAGCEAHHHGRIREAVRHPAVDVRDQRGDQRGRPEGGPDERAEAGEAGDARACLLLEACGVALDDSRIGAHVPYPSADPAADLRTFTPPLKSSHPIPNHFGLHGAMSKRTTILRRVAPLVATLALGGGIGAAVYAGLSGEARPRAPPPRRSRLRRPRSSRRPPPRRPPA